MEEVRFFFALPLSLLFFLFLALGALGRPIHVLGKSLAIFCLIFKAVTVKYQCSKDGNRTGRCLSTWLYLSQHCKESCEAAPAPSCSKSCPALMPLPLQHLQLSAMGKRSSSWVPSIDTIPMRWRKAAGGAGSSRHPNDVWVSAAPSALAMARSAVSTATSFWPGYFVLFIPLLELFKHPHLDIYVSRATALLLFPKSIIFHPLGWGTPMLPFY